MTAKQETSFSWNITPVLQSFASTFFSLFYIIIDFLHWRQNTTILKQPIAGSAISFTLCIWQLIYSTINTDAFGFELQSRNWTFCPYHVGDFILFSNWMDTKAITISWGSGLYYEAHLIFQIKFEVSHTTEEFKMGFTKSLTLHGRLHITSSHRVQMSFINLMRTTCSLVNRNIPSIIELIRKGVRKNIASKKAEMQHFLKALSWLVQQMDILRNQPIRYDVND